MMADNMSVEVKEQLNVRLPVDLVRRIKHAAVDSDVSFSAWVERALLEWLAADGKDSLILDKLVQE